AAEEASHVLRHLARRLVRERDRQDRARRHAALPDQVRDPVREGPGLAGAGPGGERDRALGVEDRLALDVVESVEQGGGDAHAWMLARTRDPTVQRPAR